MTEPKALIAAATEWLGNGGLFNPELMEKDKTTRLVVDMRDALQSVAAESLSHEDACYLSRAFHDRLGPLTEIEQYTRINDFLKATIASADHEREHAACPHCGSGFCFDFQQRKVTCQCPPVEAR